MPPNAIIGPVMKLLAANAKPPQIKTTAENAIEAFLLLSTLARMPPTRLPIDEAQPSIIKFATSSGFTFAPKPAAVAPAAAVQNPPKMPSTPPTSASTIPAVFIVILLELYFYATKTFTTLGNNRNVRVVINFFGVADATLFAPDPIIGQDDAEKDSGCGLLANLGEYGCGLC